MSATTKIEWTDRTWNPVRGCSLVSAGCTNCYAMKFAHRFSGPGKAYEGLTRLGPHGPVWTGKIRLVEKALMAPLLWRKPCRVFVNSMSDLFHEDVPDYFIGQVLKIIYDCPQHDFQILTKRPGRMRELLSRPTMFGGPQPPPPNLSLGVSAEDQDAANRRIPPLLATPAAIRFVSAEPLLGAVDLLPYIRTCVEPETCSGCDEPAVNWVICGGESGPGARPMHPDWARELRDQCQAAGVPFFFKQHGDWAECETEVLTEPPWNAVYPMDETLYLEDGRRYRTIEAHGTEFVRLGKARAGRLLDGRTWDEFPCTEKRG